MYYNYEEVLFSEMPIFNQKYEYHFLEELDNTKPYIQVGFCIVDTKYKLYKPVYKYN